jgi:hypothetical protein
MKIFLLIILVLNYKIVFANQCEPIKKPPYNLIDLKKKAEKEFNLSRKDFTDKCYNASKTIAFDMNCALKYAEKNPNNCEVLFDIAISYGGGTWALPAKVEPEKANYYHLKSAECGNSKSLYLLSTPLCENPSTADKGKEYLDKIKKIGADDILGGINAVNYIYDNCGKLTNEKAIKHQNITFKHELQKYKLDEFFLDNLHNGCNRKLINQETYNLYLDIFKKEDMLCKGILATFLSNENGNLAFLNEWLLMSKLMAGEDSNKARKMLVSMCHLNMY